MSRILLLAFLLFFYCVASSAQSIEKVYALFILNFARGIEWPEKESSEDFVIGVWDNSDIAKELRGATFNKSLNKRKILVKEFEKPDDISGCQIAFIPSKKSSSVPNISTRYETMPLLIVTEKEGLSQSGSNINFLRKNDKLQFELALQSIERKGLKVASSLKNLGIIVGR